MRKFSSQRLYDLIKYTTFLIAILGVAIGLFMVLYANANSTWMGYYNDCVNSNTFREREAYNPLDCTKVADTNVAIYRAYGIFTFIVGTIPMVLFYSIRWGYVFLFPKEKAESNPF